MKYKKISKQRYKHENTQRHILVHHITLDLGDPEDINTAWNRNIPSDGKPLTVKDGLECSALD